MTRRILLLAALLPLAGCVQPPPPVVVCPTVRSWSDTDETALAGELAEDGPLTKRALIEWAGLRGQIRACVPTAPTP